MSVYSNLEQYYNIVFDQTFSPSTKHLATCDRYGRLAVFSLAAALNISSTTGKSPVFSVVGHQGPVYCLTNAGQLLVSGGEGGIKAWNWSDLIKPNNKEIQPVAELVPPSRDQAAPPDTNTTQYSAKEQTLYSGCGDNNIYSWDVNTGQIKATLSGHKDYVHCLRFRAEGQLISGGEDGSVLLWDPSRQAGPVQTIHKGGRGKWVGCLDVDMGGEWVVCGGSAQPSIYHLSTLKRVATLATPPGVVTQSLLFLKDRIISAGCEPFIRHWTVDGEVMSTIPSAHSHAFSLAYNTTSQQYQMLTVSGDSSEVQVFTNLGYRSFSLTI